VPIRCRSSGASLEKLGEPNEYCACHVCIKTGSKIVDPLSVIPMHYEFVCLQELSPRSNTWPPEVLSSQLRPYPNGKIFMYLPKTQSTDKNGINLRSHEFTGSTAFPENVYVLWVCRSWRRFNRLFSGHKMHTNFDITAWHSLYTISASIESPKSYQHHVPYSLGSIRNAPCFMITMWYISSGLVSIKEATMDNPRQLHFGKLHVYIFWTC
jgi:hypothetical protein